MFYMRNAESANDRDVAGMSLGKRIWQKVPICIPCIVGITRGRPKVFISRHRNLDAAQDAPRMILSIHERKLQ